MNPRGPRILFQSDRKTNQGRRLDASPSERTFEDEDKPMQDELFNANIAYIEKCARMFCANKLPRHEWDDLINEVLLSVWRELKDYRDDGLSIDTFINVRVKQRAIDYMRKEHGREDSARRKKDNDVYLEDLNPSGSRDCVCSPAPYDGYSRVAVEDWVDTVLPGVENGMVKMRMSGATMKEIGHEIGLTESRVSQMFVELGRRFQWRREEISGR